MQYAGGHLRELQKAVKDPISNFGVVLGEVTKRGRSVVGLGGSNELANHVHPNLIDTSAVLCKNVELFGGAVEKVLIKHGSFSFLYPLLLLLKVAIRPCLNCLPEGVYHVVTSLF